MQSTRSTTSAARSILQHRSNRLLLILSVTLSVVWGGSIRTVLSADNAPLATKNNAPLATKNNATLATKNMVRTAEYSTDETDSKVIQASYSTGRLGHPLKWLPSRPSKKEAKPRSAVRTVQLLTPVQKRPVPLAPSSKLSPFDDPFGDFDKVSQIDPPKELNDRAIQQDSPEPSVLKTLSDPSEPPPLEGESKKRTELIPDSLFEHGVAEGPNARSYDCPSPSSMKPISEISHNIAVKSGEFPKECPLGDEEFVPRSWKPITFHWVASGLCHNPVYFEDVQLERYGHSFGPYVQPLVSGAHFFLTVPILPYKMGLYPPNECMYSLGYYRPGSCAPYLLDPLPLSVRAALAQAGGVVGLAYVLP